jgi:hypothetical protein
MLSDSSKVSSDFKFEDEIGFGNFLVGMDLMPGDHKLRLDGLWTKGYKSSLTCQCLII